MMQSCNNQSVWRISNGADYKPKHGPNLRMDLQATNIYDSHAKFRLKMTQKNMHKQIIQRNFLPLLVFVSFFMSCLMRKLCFFSPRLYLQMQITCWAWDAPTKGATFCR